MVANLGYGALVITFLVSIYGVGAAIYGVRKQAPSWIDSARNAMLLTWQKRSAMLVMRCIFLAHTLRMFLMRLTAIELMLPNGLHFVR